MISPGDTSICNECVDVCSEILQREKSASTKPPDADGWTMRTREVSTLLENTDIRGMIREMGPSFIDSQLRQSIWMLWMALPEEGRDVEAFKEMVRQRHDRIIAEVADDMNLFRPS